MPFEFDWQVRDDSQDDTNMFSHRARSDGIVTRGQYSVLLPDGRLQVHYFLSFSSVFGKEISNSNIVCFNGSLLHEGQNNLFSVS